MSKPFGGREVAANSRLIAKLLLGTALSAFAAPGLAQVQGDAPALEAAAEMLARNRSAIVINVDKTVSWDHRKLGGTY